jgi:Domain of unknown function (DUF4136)
MRDLPHERRLLGSTTGSPATDGTRRGRRRVWPAFVLILPALILGCYPGDRDDLEDFDTVTTIHDEDTDFRAIQTYVLPDTVIHIQGEDGDDDDDVELSREFDEHLLKHVRENMNARGYQEISGPTRPDAVVTVSAFGTEVTEVYYNYWCDYWGWYGWYGYPCGYYPGYTYVYTYDTGTIIIDMHDTRTESVVDERVPVIWTGSLRGVLGTSNPVTEERIHDSVDQAFRQSPYLESNP